MRPIHWFTLFILVVLACGPFACSNNSSPTNPGGENNNPTDTPLPTNSPTPTSTFSFTPTGSFTATFTATSTSTITPTLTSTPTPWPGIGTGLRGDYYNGAEFETAVLSRLDPVVHFAFGSGSPDPSVNADYYSAKWTGEVQAPYSGPITFVVNSDDAARLWVNGVLIIDDYSPHSITVDYSEGVTLTAGQKYPIELDYYEDTGNSIIGLSWKGTNLASSFIDTSHLYPAASSPPTSTPTATPSNSPTDTPTTTPTNSPTDTPSLTPTLTPDCANFVGVTTIGSSVGENVLVVFWNKVTPSASFPAGYLHFHIDSLAQNFAYMAIYSDNAGKPGSPLAKTDAWAIQDGWNSLPITKDGSDNPISSLDLDSGTTYWIAFQSAGGSYDTGSPTGIINAYDMSLLLHSLPLGTWVTNPNSVTYSSFGPSSLLLDLYASACP